MKVLSITNNPRIFTSFTSKIIDSHSHIGNWNEGNNLRDYTKDFDSFLKITHDNGDTIEKIIVSNLDCMSYKSDGTFTLDEIEGNKKLLNYAQKNPQVAPLATCQPGKGNVNNIKKLFNEAPNVFVGFKFHTQQLGLSASDKTYEAYMEYAKETNLPCLFHSGSSDAANPVAISNLSKKFKDVPVIIAHWGAEYGGDYNKVTELIIESVKNKDSKLYADISWVDCNDSTKPTLKNIIQKLKSENALDRILFGSDAPLGRFSEHGENGVTQKQAYESLINDIKSMIRKEFPSDAEEMIDKIFYKNANELFFNNSTQKPILNNRNGVNNPHKSSNKYLNFILSGIALLTILGVAWHRYNKSKSQNLETNG